MHDVRASVDALKVVEAWTKSGDAMTDRMELRGLIVRGNHGVFEQSAATVRTSSSTSRCGSISRTLLPATTSPTRSTTARWPTGPPTSWGARRNLIETVAGEIADDVMTDERVHAVEVVVHKPAARFRRTSPTSPSSRGGHVAEPRGAGVT